MFQLLTIITTTTGIFTLLDLFIEKNAKAKVAEFVFGFGTADFAGFESNAIKALLSLVKVDGRISYKRILFRYSGMIAFLILILSLLYSLSTPAGDIGINQRSKFVYILQELIWIPIFALLFWPFDCWSLKVTNRIFGSSKSKSLVQFFGRVVADIFITLLPLVLLGAALSMLNKNVTPLEGTMGDTILSAILLGAGFFLVLNVLGSLLVTFIQLLTLAIGLCLRTILRLTRLNQHIAMISRAHEFPFTFIGLVFGIVTGVSVIAFT